MGKKSKIVAIMLWVVMVIGIATLMLLDKIDIWFFIAVMTVGLFFLTLFFKDKII